MTGLNMEKEQVSDLSREILLSHCYHPELHSEHKDFAQLPVHAQWALNKLEQQSARWCHKPYFQSRGGLPNTRIAILNGYYRTDRLLNCMMERNKYGTGYGRCGLAMCPFCQYLKGQAMLKKYGLAWHPQRWHWLVISIEGFANLSRCQAEQIVDVWEAIRCGVKAWKDTVDGVTCWEELSVYSFVPDVLVTPHVNLLICTPGELDLDSLRGAVAGAWKARKLTVQPDIEPRRPKSEAHFYEMLQYFKPIDLLTPYNSGFWTARDTGDRERLHEGVRLFFEGYAEAVTEYRKIYQNKLRRKVICLIARTPNHYFGKCHGSAKTPLGMRKEERDTKEHQELMKTLKLNAKEDELVQAAAVDFQTDDQSSDL
jgi:hypothetical protein